MSSKGEGSIIHDWVYLEEKNLPNWPEEGSSPSSPCTLAHFSFPEGSRRQVSMALTAVRGKAQRVNGGEWLFKEGNGYLHVVGIG